jgi:hypothetical protein
MPPKSRPARETTPRDTWRAESLNVVLAPVAVGPPMGCAV